jgi:hypothetical protein
MNRLLPGTERFKSVVEEKSAGAIEVTIERAPR